MKNKIIILMVITSLVLISGCIGKINKNEAEKLAVNEAKSVFRNFISNADDKAFSPWFMSKQELLAEVDRMYATYSVQKGDTWVVYVAAPKSESVFEVYVYSRDNIQIPKLEEAMRNGRSD